MKRTQIIQINQATLSFNKLLDLMARQLGRWELSRLKTEEKHTALHRFLRHHRCLILVDNLETAENANKLVVDLRSFLNGSRALVTSRKKVRHGFIRALSVQGLEAEDSLFFLRNDAQQRDVQQIMEATRDQLIEIHKVTSGAPLALKLVVRQAKFLGLGQILDELKQVGGEIYPFVFQRSWRELSIVSQRLLIYMGRTVVTNVGWAELAGVGIAQSEMELKQAIEELIDYSLLDVSFIAGDPRYSIHQLTREFVNSDLPKIWKRQGLL